MFNGGCITADMFGKCFYQPEDFFAVSHGRVNILLPKNFTLTENIALFLVTILEKEFELKYSYNRMLSQEKLNNTFISLPQTNDGNPNWNFIEKYINYCLPKVEEQSENIINLAKKDRNTISNLSSKVNFKEFNLWANDTKIKSAMPLDLNNWREFKIGELFTTYTGDDLILGNIEIGNIPVVTHSSVNNGVASFTDTIPGRKLFDFRKTISLADRGTFFASIQNENFYIGTRVKALESKYDLISREALMFIAVIINLEQFRFSYGRNCTGSLDNLVIKLPAQIENNNFKIDKNRTFSKDGFIPDWEYMTIYISSLPYSYRL